MRHLKSIILAMSLTLGAATAACTQSAPSHGPADTAVPVQRSFQDWRVACDNGARCYAWAASETEPTGWIRIALSAGADAEPEIAAGTDSLPATTTGLEIDARAFTMSPSTLPDSQWIGTLEGEPARRAINALAAARTARVTGGDTPRAVSLSGLTQSLGWIDRQQGRTGTVTAWLDRGERPASTVPPAPALPPVRTAAAYDQTGFGEGATAPASVEAMPDFVACRDSWGEMYRPARPFSARLDASTELWGLACSMTTYNTGFLVFLTGPDGRDPRRLTLAGTVEETDTFINPDYDPETRTLGQSLWRNKWGHCGRSQVWVWTGTTFALQSERAMDDCKGIPPPYWPTLWRTRSTED